MVAHLLQLSSQLLVLLLLRSHRNGSVSCSRKRPALTHTHTHFSACRQSSDGGGGGGGGERPGRRPDGQNLLVKMHTKQQKEGGGVEVGCREVHRAMPRPLSLCLPDKGCLQETGVSVWSSSAYGYPPGKLEVYVPQLHSCLYGGSSMMCGHQPALYVIVCGLLAGCELLHPPAMCACAC